MSESRGTTLQPELEADHSQNTSRAPILHVDDLRVTFGRGARSVKAVNGISYKLFAGSTLAIIGESGSGKSVSSRALLGLLPESALVEGSVYFGNQNLLALSESEMRRHRGSSLSMVFQDPRRALNPTMKLGSQVTEAVRAHQNMDRKAAKEVALDLLRMVRLPEPRQRFVEYPHQLSGGMRQRIAIAIALASNPRVLIADEATSSLDVTTQAQIMELLADLQGELGMGLIMISHDLGLAASYADEVLVMYAGRAVEQAPTRELFSHVRMPYTRALLDAIPRTDRPPHALFPQTPGQPPNLSKLPTGCPFSSRCAHVQDRCLTERPPFEEHEADHRWACWYPIEDSTLVGEPQ